MLRILLTALLTAACSGSRDWPVPPAIESAAQEDALILEAVTSAREAVLKAPASVDARLELAKYFAASEIHAPARIAFAQAIEVGANDSRTYSYLASSCHGDGDLAAALEHIACARVMDPSHAPLAWREGLWRLESGEPELARTAFQAATEIDSMDVNGWVGLGRAELQSDDPGAALVAFEAAEAVARGRQKRYVAHMQGTALQRLGRIAEAQAKFESGEPQDFIPRDPWHRELSDYDVGFQGRMKVARRALRQGRSAEAIEILEALLERLDPNRRVIDNLASVFLVAGLPDRARAVLAKHTDIPASANTLYLQALVREAAGAPFEEVAELYAESLELNPRFAPTLGRVAEHEAETGELESALGHLETALSDGEPQLGWIRLAARLAGELEQWDRAIVHLERGLMLEPGSAELQVELQAARSRAGAKQE